MKIAPLKHDIIVRPRWGHPAAVISEPGLAAIRAPSDPEDRHEAALARMRRNSAAIAAIPTGAIDGTIACPSCGRPLHYAYTANGVKAHCETPRCTNVSE